MHPKFILINNKIWFKIFEGCYIKLNLSNSFIDWYEVFVYYIEGDQKVTEKILIRKVLTEAQCGLYEMGRAYFNNENFISKVVKFFIWHFSCVRSLHNGAAQFAMQLIQLQMWLCKTQHNIEEYFCCNFYHRMVQLGLAEHEWSNFYFSTK